MWDAIVIGSGIGGLAAAASLAKCGRRVLVLEQHAIAGGLTQTFERHGWRFATGVHYIGGVGARPGPAGQFGRLLSWLTDGELRFVEAGNPFDIVHIGNETFDIRAPESTWRADLRERFPREHAAIDGWLADCAEAEHTAAALFAQRALPPIAAWVLRQWSGDDISHWTRMTLGQRLERIADPTLRALLGARWADHGAPPSCAPFFEHALVTGSYKDGAYYPAGGPARFAQTFVPVIEGAGGELRCGADVRHIDLEHDRAAGVRYVHEGRWHAEHSAVVISAAGIGNTVASLPPAAAPAWQDTLRGLQPGLAHVALYLGLEGDISAAGASAANHWFYDSADIGRLWRSPTDEDAPSLFVSFPSLKDPGSHAAATAEVVAVCDPEAFAPWLAQPDSEPRSEAYLAFKGWVEDRLLSQFKRCFPGLAPLVRFHELSTPLSQRRYVRSPAGAMYGIEMSAARLTTPALRIRTPIPGLLLAGQDVASPGVAGAFMGGLMAAASVEPKLLRHLAS
jgi:all-trans-retinol 13,14-reductase